MAAVLVFAPNPLVGVNVLPNTIWDYCITHLQDELPAQQFNTWIRPLRAEKDNALLRLVAPNRFVMDWVNDKYIDRIQSLVKHNDDHEPVHSLHRKE